MGLRCQLHGSGGDISHIFIDVCENLNINVSLFAWDVDTPVFYFHSGFELLFCVFFL